MSERNTKIKYDKVDQQYGLMFGKSKLVFIKTGAAASLIDAKKVIPYHFNTFPPIKQDVNDFWKDVPENMKFIAEIDKAFEL